jgi:Tol biopolymer transport system component
VLRISQAGGTAEVVTKIDPPRETTHGYPYFLPDGQRFLFSAGGAVYLTSLDGTQKRKLIGVTATDASAPATPAISRAQYAPPRHKGDPGHLLYVRDATLMAQPVDPESLEQRGDAIPVAEQLSGAFGGALAYFSVSSSGALAYRAGGFSAGFTLRWFDRSGTALESIGRVGTYTDIALSKSGTQAAVTFVDDQSSTPDIWIADTAQAVLSRFTSSPAAEISPVWAPDDRRLAFSSLRTAQGLQGFIQGIDGAKEQQVVSTGRIRDWSSDGRYVLYDYRDSSGLFRFWVMPLDGDRKPIAYTHDRFNLAQGQFAPGDGTSGPPRWIAYVSNETGANNVYLQSFPPTGRGVLVSTGGGAEPRWRRDGKELFYVSPNGTLMAVDVTLTPTLNVGPPRELFKSPIASGGPRAFAFHYDVTPDGKRFLLIARPDQTAPAASPITVVLNWQATLRK